MIFVLGTAALFCVLVANNLRQAVVQQPCCENYQPAIGESRLGRTIGFLLYAAFATFFFLVALALYLSM